MESWLSRCEGALQKSGQESFERFDDDFEVILGGCGVDEVSEMEDVKLNESCWQWRPLDEANGMSSKISPHFHV